jgi:hypothetical protein
VANKSQPSAPPVYTKTVTTLSEKEERLLESLRKLPADAADRVIDWTEQLADLADGRPVHWSDAWTCEDLTDAQSAAIRNFDEQEPSPE